VRVASLLPSATEIACALGLEVVGVSHECDHPPAVRGLPVLTRARVDSSGSSAAIQAEVQAALLGGLSLYEVDEARLREVRPDLVITQDVCAVCAVSIDDVQGALARLTGARLVALSPHTLADTFADIERVADAAGVPARGRALAESLRLRAADMRSARPRSRPRVVALEWLDPPMVAGHWTPELLRLAGADPVLCHDAAPTRARPWADIVAADPDVLLLIPCGFTPAQTARELHLIPPLRARTIVMDGNAYFNRPGPRLLEGAALLAARL